MTTQTYETYNRPLKRTFPDGGWADWTYFDQYNNGKYRTRVRTRRQLNGSQQSIRNRTSTAWDAWHTMDSSDC